MVLKQLGAKEHSTELLQNPDFAGSAVKPQSIFRKFATIFS